MVRVLVVTMTKNAAEEIATKLEGLLTTLGFPSTTVSLAQRLQDQMLPSVKSFDRVRLNNKSAPEMKDCFENVATDHLESHHHPVAVRARMETGMDSCMECTPDFLRRNPPPDSRSMKYCQLHYWLRILILRDGEDVNKTCSMLWKVKDDLRLKLPQTRKNYQDDEKVQTFKRVLYIVHNMTIKYWVTEGSRVIVSTIGNVLASSAFDSANFHALCGDEMSNSDEVALLYGIAKLRKSQNAEGTPQRPRDQNI